MHLHLLFFAKLLPWHRLARHSLQNDSGSVFPIQSKKTKSGIAELGLSVIQNAKLSRREPVCGTPSYMKPFSTEGVCWCVAVIYLEVGA